MGALSIAAGQDDTSSASSREDARRQMAVRDAMQELQEARNAYQAKRYTEAEEHYRNALAVLPKTDSTKAQLKFIQESLSDALIAKAIDYRSVGRYEEAVEFLKEAVALAPSSKRAQKELAFTSDPVRNNPAVSPKLVGDVEEVNRLLTLGYGYLDLGRYDEAISTFQSVRQYDSYNAAAQRGIEQAQKRRQSYLTSARDAARAKALAEVDKTWEEPVTEVGLPAEAAGEAHSEVTGAVEGEVEAAYAEKLAGMEMPQFICDDASVMDVVEALQNQITRFESGSSNSARHINLTTNFGTPDSAGYKELMAKRVQLNLTQVSVRDVLDMLTSQLGISYYYVPSGVELSYSGKDFGPLVERTFVVPPHFFDQTKDDEEDEDDMSDSFETSSRMTVKRVNPAKVLKEMGVTFPAGATARYMPSTRQLHVRNTAYNLEAIQDLLNAPLETEQQVVFNVIVMEVSQKNLEELGFDWLLNIALNGEAYLNGGVEQSASRAAGLPSVTGHGGEDAAWATSGLRSGNSAIGVDSLDSLIETGSAYNFNQSNSEVAPGIFSLRGVWNTADVAMIMRGLNQKKGVDILQNPRIVMSLGSDEQVTFANVREIYYPETYEQGDVSSHSFTNSDDERQSGIVATGAIPSDFVRFGMSEDEVGGIGTILQIHSAELSEDGRFVNLAFTTTVTDFEGFINWGSPIESVIWSAGNTTLGIGESSMTSITLSNNYILKPVFKRRLANTSISVAPGTVLVFAGLKDAKKVRYEDKVPILGDLPLVGRFFRSEGEETTRKVLIYFARVDLVDPAGRDVRTGERPAANMDPLN